MFLTHSGKWGDLFQRNLVCAHKLWRMGTHYASAVTNNMTIDTPPKHIRICICSHLAMLETSDRRAICKGPLTIGGVTNAVAVL